MAIGKITQKTAQGRSVTGWGKPSTTFYTAQKNPFQSGKHIGTLSIKWCLSEEGMKGFCSSKGINWEELQNFKESMASEHFPIDKSVSRVM